METKMLMCKSCDYKNVNRSNLKRHVESVHEGKRHPCSHCDYQATQLGHLKRHIKSSHEGIKYSCSHCDYQATQNNNLRLHVIRVHNDSLKKKKRFKSIENGVKAKKKPNLERKTQSTQQVLQKDKIKPKLEKNQTYQCNYCDYKGKKQTLKRHIASIHEGVKHPCHICSYKATMEVNLIRHIRIVHENFRFDCSICEYKATDKRQLKTHIQKIHIQGNK